MPSFLEMLRLGNIFNPTIYGNDLPSQGGITGNMGGPNIFTSIGDIFAPKRPNPMSTVDFSQAGPAGPAAPQPQGSTTPESPANRVGARMQEIYQPSTEATDEFNRLIGAYPKYEEYKPGWLRRIGAMLTAFGPSGTQGGMEFLNRPYTGQLEEWKAKVGPAQQAANLERQENVNLRTLAYQTVGQELKAEADAARAKAADERNEIFRLKTMMPNMKFDASGPTVVVMDPRTGQVTQTNIPTGALSQADKLALQQEQALERIGTTGEQMRQTEQLRQTGREGMGETRGWSLGMIPDPTDPSKQISVRINAITGEVQPVQFQGQQAGPIVKPGAKTTGAGTQTPEQLQAIQDKTRETLSSLNELIDDKGKLRPEVKSAVGASRMFGLQHLPATQTRAGDVAIKRLKSMLVVDLIGEMKSQSRTGATGFGQLNLRELAVLENAASKLDPALDETTFEAELNRIKERLGKILQPTTGFDITTTPAPKAKPTAAELIKKYGG